MDNATNIRQVMQKVEVAFRTARLTAFPRPAQCKPPSVLEVASVSYVEENSPLAIPDTLPGAWGNHTC